MREILGWIVAVVIVGLVFFIVDRYVPKEGTFALLFRIMAGIIAVILFLGFLMAVIKYMNIPLPW